MIVRLAVNAGYRFIFSKDSDLLEHNDGIKIDLIRSGGLTWLPIHFSPTPAASVTRDLIHCRFGHLHEDGLVKLDKLGVRGASGFSKLLGIQLCPSYAIVKSKVADINRKSTRESDPSSPFHTVALDIWGPMPTPDLTGHRWAQGAACYKTSTTLCSLIKSKTEAASCWKGFIIMIKALNFNIRRVRIDNDSVFLIAQFTQLCQDEQIIVERTVPYAQWQLERIERQWRTLAEGAKTLLVAADLPDKFWGHAFMVMVYIRNRTWSARANGIP
jgi:hypothetical protein